MTMMTRPGVGQRTAHDPGDPLVTSHCPFCGSGQVVGRSDGTIGCDFCGQNYIVRVQPAFPGMPQMPMGPGAPSDVGPDGGLVDPGMIGPDGAPVDDGGMPPGEDPEGGDMPPGDDEGGPPPDDGGGDDDAPPPKSKSKKKGSYRGLEGQALTEDQFLRHVAVRASRADPRVMAALRRSAAGRRPPRKTAMRVEHNHEDMPEDVLRHHMRAQHGFIDTADDPDWVIDETHRNEHADAPLDHVHPDLEAEYGEDIHLGDRDWLHQNGIEASRRRRPFSAVALSRRNAAREKTDRDHYRRGWAASERAGYWNGEGESALDKADGRDEPDAWYHGYHDYGSDRPKYHTLECPGTGDHDGRNGCTLR